MARTLGVNPRTVRQILGEKGITVRTIGPDASVLDALPVVDDGELLGLVSERDYARKVILRGRFSKDTPVREIMSTDLVTVTSTQNVHDCMRLMTDKRIRHLPVVENGQLSGIISIGDAVKGVMEQQRETIEELEGYITGRR